MDQESPMADTAEAVDHWGGSTAEELVREFARTQNAIAGHHSAGVTFPGETADMNAPLVNAVRHAKTLEFVLDLHGLADQVRRQEERQACIRAREAKRASHQAYSQGVADGVEKGKEYHAREVAESEQRAHHGNPTAVRELAPVLTPKGHVAAWKIVHEDPDGMAFAREVYGTLDDDVREGDTRAVVRAGQDRFLVGLDRVRFADTLHALVAERDTGDLAGVELLSFGTYRAQDSMDGSARLDVQITEMTEDEAAEGCKAGTYVRIQTAENGTGDQRVTVDLTLARWNSLADAVEKLYARHLVRREKDAEK